MKHFSHEGWRVAGRTSPDSHCGRRHALPPPFSGAGGSLRLGGTSPLFPPRQFGSVRWVSSLSAMNAKAFRPSPWRLSPAAGATPLEDCVPFFFPTDQKTVLAQFTRPGGGTPPYPVALSPFFGSPLTGRVSDLPAFSFSGSQGTPPFPPHEEADWGNLFLRRVL